MTVPKLFRREETPIGFSIPPRVNLRVVLAASLTLPMSAIAAMMSGSPLVLIVHIMMILAFGWLSGTQRQFWFAGYDAGRVELIGEMLEAWAHRDIDPREYVLREVALHPEEVRDAREQVSKSFKRSSD